MCEPLREKIIDERVDEDDPIDNHIYFTKNDVKSAVEFYNKYKDNPAKLMEEQPKHYSDFYEGMKINHKVSFFEYCFGDVI